MSAKYHNAFDAYVLQVKRCLPWSERGRITKVSIKPYYVVGYHPARVAKLLMAD